MSPHKLPAKPIVFYSYPLSGHAHRVELLLSMLNLPFEKIDLDLRAKAQKVPEFMRLNPFGQVPVIDDNGVIVWDSAAILVYLAKTYDSGYYLPNDAFGEAQTIAWLAKAAGPIAYGLAAARRGNLFGACVDMLAAQALGAEFLDSLHTYLGDKHWLVGDHVTIADLACYTYIAHAFEGGIDVNAYSHVMAWLKRIEALDGFVAMPKSAVGLWAKQQLGHR